MSRDLTMLKNLVNPEVLADMIQAKMKKKISVLPYAKLDTILQGQAGDTIKIPKFVWDGEAQEVPEGEEIPLRNLGTETVEYTIKKTGIGGQITDEAVLSGYGDPVAALGNGIVKSILTKCDNDAVSELMKAKTVRDANSTLGYTAIVDGVDLFAEEDANADKVILVNPHQLTQLRKDPDFIDKTKYGNDVMIDGEIGTVAGVRIKPSARIDGCGGFFYSPIIKLETDIELEDEIPALTYYMKRDTNIETERKARRRLTEITGDQIYSIALTNDSKVVLLKTTGAPLKAQGVYEEEFKFPGYNTVWNTQGYSVSCEITNRATTDTNGTATVKLKGLAPKLVDPASIGFDASTTKSGAVVLVEVPFIAPNAKYSDVFYAAGTNTPSAVGENDVTFINGVAYLVLGKGFQNNEGKAAQNTATFRLGTAADKYYTFTLDISELSVEE